MAAVQTSYPTSMAPGVPGMIANAESVNTITRTADAGIGFGLPVIRTGDRTCILATQETLEAAAPVAQAGNTGNGTFAATPTITAGAKEGTYRVEITAAASNAGTFAVEDPEGNLVGIGTVAVAFSQGGVAFTLQDGATDFAVNDGFTFAVSPTSGTADLDLLGISIRDTSLDVSNADAYEQYDNVGIMERGVIWVTAGATVVAGQEAYWNPATSRYTITATHLPVTINGRRAKFDSAGADGDVVKLAVR
jgi:hypothetical protein